MQPHIKVLSRDYAVTLVATGPSKELEALASSSVRFISIHIERQISPITDLLALSKLWQLFRNERFDCVHSITPKAGLLAMTAARMAGVPWRFHTFTGQVWANYRGVKRSVFSHLDKLLATNATHLLADSASQRQFLIDSGIVRETMITVLASGSLSGVDLLRFRPNSGVSERVRRMHGIPQHAVVFIFLGRLTHDKGVVDLVHAFALAARIIDDIHLLVVGPDEDGLTHDITRLAEEFPGRVHQVGMTYSPEHYMAAADVLCLPSYREGFGTVIIQAGAAGLPVIASHIYGIVDAVDAGVTGILHPPKGIAEIAHALILLASDDGLRLRMGTAARERACTMFSEEIVTGAQATFYRQRVGSVNRKSS